MRQVQTLPVVALCTVFATALLLGACGRAGPPRQPGPKEAITYPRVYPAPDPTLQPRAMTIPVAPVPSAASLQR